MAAPHPSVSQWATPNFDDHNSENDGFGDNDDSSGNNEDDDNMNSDEANNEADSGKSLFGGDSDSGLDYDPQHHAGPDNLDNALTQSPHSTSDSSNYFKFEFKADSRHGNAQAHTSTTASVSIDAGSTQGNGTEDSEEEACSEQSNSIKDDHVDESDSIALIQSKLYLSIPYVFASNVT